MSYILLSSYSDCVVSVHSLQNKQHYYRDTGIRDDVIRQAEQEALELAKLEKFDIE